MAPRGENDTCMCMATLEASVPSSFALNIMNDSDAQHPRGERVQKNPWGECGSIHPGGEIGAQTNTQGVSAYQERCLLEVRDALESFGAAHRVHLVGAVEGGG